MEPRLLLMDEPLASLDEALKADILPLIERLRDEFAIPILYVSHSVSEVVRLASHAVRLSHGKVVAAGPIEEVLSGAFGTPRDADESWLSLLTLDSAKYDPAFDVSRLDHPAGAITVPGRLGNGPLRLAIAANQIALVKGDPGRSSVRTMLKAKVRSIETRQDAYAMVRLELDGGDRLSALITRLAVADLELQAGDAVLALVKSVSIDRQAIGRG
jgi:molybdate transport system ATP-binding protein